MIPYEEIKISIALVTRNRPQSLRRCLTSWRSQGVRPYEIVISDDSDDSIRTEIQHLATEFNARWVPGPRNGLYSNRNHAANQCWGTHVFSSDDDHEHPPDLLEKCLEALYEDPGSAWCLGEVWAWEKISTGWMIPGELTLKGIPNAPADLSHSWGWSDGATLCPRKVFDSGLKFHDGFRFGFAYLEFGCLLHSIGQRIRILSSTGVIHHFQEAHRSFELPLEECASRYFASIMLATVYQPSFKNSVALGVYFFKQLLRQPIVFSKAIPWAVRESRRRLAWFRQWQITQTS